MEEPKEGGVKFVKELATAHHHLSQAARLTVTSREDPCNSWFRATSAVSAASL